MMLTFDPLDTEDPDENQPISNNPNSFSNPNDVYLNPLKSRTLGSTITIMKNAHNPLRL